ncbi:acyltransferase [Nitrosococcus wardiae]|uniref:Acyltransferase n=1 Tax=Nitrosococcus wardiae TaxID=1814290 RepID=A0A4P7C459_9GAMM|nr:acyltransferase [Nitrosococcus wardiae]
MDLTVGSASLRYFLLYEILTFFLGSLSGGIGFLLRKKFYPFLFKNSGRGLIIGRNVVLRHPAQIALGDNVTVDDNSVIDGRGAGSEEVTLENHVIINRNCMLLAKAGPIRLGSRTSIGSNSVIVSMSGVEFGEAVLVAGGCYFSAGAYHMEDSSRAIMDQGTYSKGPIRVGDNAWIGTGAIILDGITIGPNAIVGAGAVVTKDVPEKAIVAGIPATIIRMRK